MEKRENEMQITRHSFGSNMYFCLKNMMKGAPALGAACGLAIVVNMTIPVIGTFLPGIIVGKILGGETLRTLIAVTAAVTGVLAVLLGLKCFLERYVMHRRQEMTFFYLEKLALKGMRADYRCQETESFRRLHMESFLTCHNTGAPLSRIYGTWTSFGTAALGFALYAGILLRPGPLLLLLLALPTIISYRQNGKVIRWSGEHMEEKAGFAQRADYLTSMATDLRAAKDIRLYHMQGWLEDTWRKNAAGLGRWYGQYAKKVFGVAVCDGGLSLVRDGAAYAYLVCLTAAGRISVADFVVYFGVVTGFSVWLGGLLEQLALLKQISLSTDCLRTFLDYPEEGRRENGEDVSDLAKAPAEIRLQDVSYRYAGAEGDALSHISLRIAPGEHVAVVGLNGAGKSTLVKLICGLVDPTEGVVKYHGEDVRSYDRRSYYRLFSAVFQQFSLLPVTFAQIVAEARCQKPEEKRTETGRKKAEQEQPDRSRVEACLRQAGLWEKISCLEQGMDGRYSRAIWDEGTELSGGEIQKLLLARALYKDAPVILLDEPTAALDPIAENRLYQVYDELMKGRTVVFVSHRLASTRFCDRIILIGDGVIAEEGTHEELLAQNGRYSKLYETQAKYYRDPEAACGPDGVRDGRAYP